MQEIVADANVSNALRMVRPSRLFRFHKLRSASYCNARYRRDAEFLLSGPSVELLSLSALYFVWSALENDQIAFLSSS
jgi:hypothetical protein